jgi:hypothetical protein
MRGDEDDRGKSGVIRHVAQQALDRVDVHVADAAQDLHGVVDDRPGTFGVGLHFTTMPRRRRSVDSVVQAT